MKTGPFLITALFLGSAMLGAGELPPEIVAKSLKIISTNAGSAGKIACKDAGMAAELAKVGVTADPSSKVAWAASDGEIAGLKGAGKLVVCGRLDWLAKGGSIAVVEEGGKPAIYLHTGNIGASGVTLSDAILKIGKKAN